MVLITFPGDDLFRCSLTVTITRPGALFPSKRTLAAAAERCIALIRNA